MNIEILKDATILFVEDEESLRETITTFLSDDIGNLITAKNGLEGLEVFKSSLEKNKIDLIITDITMPKMDGFEMIEKIRELDHIIPIVILSAHDGYDFLKRSINLHVNGYSLKPVDLPSLVKTLIQAYEANYLRKSLEEKIQERTKDLTLFKDAIDSVDTGFTLVDANKEDMPIIYANKTFEKMTEYTFEEVYGKNCRFLQGKDNDQEAVQTIRDAIKNKQACQVELKNYTKSGKFFWNDLILTPIFDETGELQHYVGIQHDITKKKEFYKNLEKFIDTQDNIVILTDGKKITFANKKFFDFLGFNSLEDFLSHNNCICELFIHNDRFFHLGKIADDENWVNEIQKLQEPQRIVSILGTNFIPNAFSVNINQFDESHFIISFADISHTMIENIALKNKVIQDKLTGAFNREYFEMNCQRFINEYNTVNSQLAIALIDIDHFKSVNDTYGHDVGDDVLVHFVKTVKKFSRNDDVFIRWGGEEFVLILKVTSTQDLEKALEHLRSVIEMQNFPTVGQKTCSIGGSLYRDNEDIHKTIKRADEAVYDAKNAGRNRVVIN